MANDSGNPRSVSQQFGELADAIKKSNDEMLAFQTESFLKRKEEEQERLAENRANFEKTRETIIDKIGRAIKIMTKKIVNAILLTSSLLIRLISFGVALVLAKIYQVIATTFASFKITSGVLYFFLNYLPRAVPQLIRNINGVIANLKAFFQGIRITKSLFLALALTMSAATLNIRTSIASFFALIKAYIVGTTAFQKVAGMVAIAIAKLMPLITFLTKTAPKLKPALAVFGFFFKVLQLVGVTAGQALKILGFVAKIMTTAGKVVAAIFRFIKPFLPFIRVLGTVAKLIPGLGIAIMIIEGIVGFFRGFLGTQGTILEKIGAGLAGFFAQILSGLTFGLLSFDDIMGFFGFVLDEGKGLLSAFIDFNKKVFGFAAGYLFSAFGGIGEFIDEEILPIWNTVSSAISGFFSTLKEFFVDTVPAVFIKFKDAFVESLIAVLRIINNVDFTGYVQSAIDTLKGFKSTAPANINQTTPDRSLNNATNRNAALRGASPGAMGPSVLLNNSPSINNQTFIKQDVNPHREGVPFMPINDDYRAAYGRRP